MRALLVVGLAIATQWTGGLLDSQQISRNPDAAEVAMLLRTVGHGGQTGRVLAQIDGPQPKEKLDAFADSLTEVALSLQGDDFETVKARRSAVGALHLAGIGEGGTPYQGAAERLLRLALGLPSGGALGALTQLPNRGQALQFMRQVAISQHRLATPAVGHLGRDMGSEGLAMLRQLHRQGLVTQEWAPRELAGIAQYHGWQEP